MARFELPGMIFKSKKAAFEYTKAILNEAVPGKLLQGPREYMARAVLGMHPSCGEKLNGYKLEDVKLLVREVSEPFASRCFFLIRPDGSMIDWSYLVCFGRAPHLPMGVPIDRIEEASRRAVDPDVFAYKQMRYAGAEVIACDETGEPVLFREAHVDHAEPWPFAAILKAFLAEHGPCALHDMGLYLVFADPADAQAFREFHNARAVLRLVHRDVNLRGRGNGQG